MLPILHLNGYKIANPTVLARISQEELESLFSGYGYHPYFVEGDEPIAMHEAMAATLDAVCAEIRDDSGRRAPQRRHSTAALADDRPAHAEGLDRSEGSRRREGRRLPGARIRCRCGDVSRPEHLKLLEDWMKSYRPEELFDDDGSADARAAGTCAARAAPHGRQSRTPTAACCSSDLRMPDFRSYAVEIRTSPAS